MNWSGEKPAKRGWNTVYVFVVLFVLTGLMAFFMKLILASGTGA